MRPLPIIAAACSIGAVLTACSSATTSAPVAAASTPRASQCAVTLQAWLAGPGGSAFHSVLTAGVAMGAALESGSQARLSGAAEGLDSAAGHASGHLPPACADQGAAYQTALHDWRMGASDARDGYLTSASSRIASGAHAIDVVSTLRQLSPTLIGDLARPVAIPVASTAPAATATSAPPAVATPAPPTTRAAATMAPSMAPSTAPAASPTTAAASPTGCYPLSDEGTCYEPGEFCRDDDHGVSGVAGDGKTITCEDNDGWRWEPTSS